jgi:hypothetical protein
MRKGIALWTAFLVLGVLIWLESNAAPSHPIYRLCLMVAAFSWFGYTARTPKPVRIETPPTR